MMMVMIFNEDGEVVAIGLAVGHVHVGLVEVASIIGGGGGYCSIWMVM